MCGQCAEGLGPSKKVAKRNAAETMLELLGYKVPQPLPKPALKTDEKAGGPAGVDHGERTAAGDPGSLGSLGSPGYVLMVCVCALLFLTSQAPLKKPGEQERRKVTFFEPGSVEEVTLGE